MARNSVFTILWCLCLLAGLLVTSSQAQTVATLTSDKDDYAPGEVAVLTGAGFQSQELIFLNISIDDPISGLHIDTYDWTVEETDCFGGFITTYTVPIEAAYMTLTATATGMDSGLVATTTFTDAPLVHNINFATVGLPTGIAVSVNWSKINPAGNPANGTRSFTAPGPSGNEGTQTGSVFAYAFPATVTSAGVTYVLAGSVPASGFTTGAAGASTTITATYEVEVTDVTPPTTSMALNGTAGKNGWYVSDVEVTLTATDDDSGINTTEYSTNGGATWTQYTVPFTISAEGATTLRYRSTDNAGNTEVEKTASVNIDKTAPAIEGAATTDPNTNGWYNTDVTVHFTASDAVSGMASVTPDTTLTTEGAGQSVIGTAEDLAGNTASFTVSGINIDKTAPGITGAATTSPNANGWYKADVAVHFTAGDALSGVASVTPDVTLTAEGANQSVTGTAVDLAGNTASFTVGGINIDKTAPIIGGAATTDPNTNGWYNTDVTVHFTASDALSGMASVTPDTTLTTEGAGQSVIGTAEDLAGNTASFTVGGINIDKTAPFITGAATTSPNANGWYKTDVTIHFTASDNGSTLASVTPDTTLTTEGAGQSVTGTAEDLAGNTATFTVGGINIDKTAPGISGAATTNPNNNGWYNTDVTVHFMADDALSGVSSVTPDAMLTMEGANQSATGTAVDLAGNEASFTVEGINIDKTVPTISGAATTAPNANGWYNTDVTVHFIAGDALSGVAAVTPDVTLTTEGAGQTVTGSAEDLAGNTASFTVSGINIDKTAPTIIGAATTSPNANGWYNTDVTVHFTAGDSLAGVASVTPDITLSSEGANQSTTGTAVDLAGNTATFTVGDINIDKTAPGIIGAATTAPNANGWYKTDVTVHFTAGDGLSGVASVTPDVTLTAEGANQSVIGTAVDLAGNSASFTVSGINIDKTAPTIIGAATTSPNANGWYRTSVTVHFTAGDSLSGVASVTPDVTLSSEGANQSTTGTAVDLAGNTASFTVGDINIDTTPPVITITAPENGGTYLLNAVVPANWTATDALSGIDATIATKQQGQAIETITAGAKSFSVSATDLAGNTAVSSVNYRVQYAFGNFLQPINNDGSSIFKQGSTVPVKFQLRDANGAYISTAVASIYLTKISNGTFGSEVEAVSTSAATTGNLFRYDALANQYIFNLGTRTLSHGTWQIRVLLDDGTSQYVTISLKK